MFEKEELAGQETDDVLNINIDELFKDTEESQPQENTSNDTEDSKKSDEPSQMTKHMTERINSVRRKTEAETQEKIRRICIRDNISEELAMQRLKIQNDNEFFTKKADFVIHNDGTLEKLSNSLKEIIEKI